MPSGTCTNCKTLTPLGAHRCARCTKQHNNNRNRLSARERGYNTEYEHNRALLLARNNVCWLCNQKGANTADHIIPLSLGGTNKITNLKPAHLKCNSSRGNRTPNSNRGHNQ